MQPDFVQGKIPMNKTKNRANSFKKSILLIWAFAIFWFYLGSLINFHQHRIWGKHLIPAVFTSTRSKQKEGIAVFASKTSSSVLSKLTLHLVAILSIDNRQLSSGHRSTACFADKTSGVTSEISVSRPLRAPPLV